MTGDTTRPPEYLAMAVQHDLEPRERKRSSVETDTCSELPSDRKPKHHLENQERSLNDYSKNKLEPTATMTRCGWTTTYIATRYRFLRSALLCRSDGNNTLASTKDTYAKKNGT